ncbi:erythritol ABC transporter membrane protein [Pasteurella testudinis DSM 23072]|uniref:Erythritol ABC transporter membrane protein n=1 Tax=Pasteurella testudinis DSM 23072 TaxID=1122938 RepID=A0A1W1V6T6_9PAST|nr:ABC transporter permease [Pasteurella testudinis]SMB88975.1 erythritol ABC transporter membrane protein [Pasteurella testudinis DSM 23072]SUB50243.1 ribose transport system permease protein RbsC-1 [Pasteurella testudinis]
MSTRAGSGNLILLLLKLRTFIALIIILGFFTIAVEGFLNPSSLIIMVKHISINALLALGITFVIITAGIDLSIGAILGLCGMVAGYLISKGIVLPMFGVAIFPSIWVIVPLVILLGGAIGAVNGFIITRYNVAPFICTLGTMYIIRGAAMLTSNGETFPGLSGNPQLGNTGFEIIGAGTLLGIPYSIWLMFIVAGVIAYIAKKLPFGRHVYAIDDNERAAELSGIKVNNTKVWVYVISGICAALAGIVVTSQLVASHPATGNAFEMNAIAAVVLGGTSLAGGRGTIGGTLIGAFVIGILADGLVMMGVSEFWQMVIKGIVIIVAVVIDQLQNKLQYKAAVASQKV